MKREELWEIFVKANPSFGREGYVTMSAKGLRKLFDTTWDQAERHAAEVARRRQGWNQQNDIFNGIFGKMP